MTDQLTWADTKQVLYMSAGMGAFAFISAWACYGWYYAWRFGLAGFIVFFLFLFGVGVTGEQ